MTKRFLKLLLAIPLLALFGVLLPTSAQASDNYITGTKFISVDYSPIKMCHGWVIDQPRDGCGTSAGNKRFIQRSVSNIYRCTHESISRGCPSGTVLNWNDTDGFYQPRGWNVATNVMGLPTGWNKYKKYDGHWIKVRSCGCWKAIKKYPKG